MQRHRMDDDDEDALEKPENVPSFLTARELQARDPVKRENADADGTIEEDQASAPSDGEKKPKGRKPPRS